MADLISDMIMSKYKKKPVWPEDEIDGSKEDEDEEFGRHSADRAGRVGQDDLNRMPSLHREELMKQLSDHTMDARYEDTPRARVLSLSEEGEKAFNAMRSGEAATGTGRQEVVDAALDATRTRGQQTNHEVVAQAPVTRMEKAPAKTLAKIATRDAVKTEKLSGYYLSKITGCGRVRVK